MFLDSDGHKRRLDFLESVYGMNSEDIRTTAIEIDLLPGEGRQLPVWVIHPERCMESRVHNSVLANKQTDLAWRQLEASVACARAFSRLLLDERGEATIHDVLKLNERIFGFAQGDRCSSSYPTEASRPSTRYSMTTDFPRSSGPFVCHRCRSESGLYVKPEADLSAGRGRCHLRGHS
jgi:hypothetical protein